MVSPAKSLGFVALPRLWAHVKGFFFSLGRKDWVGAGLAVRLSRWRYGELTCSLSRLKEGRVFRRFGSEDFNPPRPHRAVP